MRAYSRSLYGRGGTGQGVRRWQHGGQPRGQRTWPRPPRREAQASGGRAIVVEQACRRRKAQAFPACPRPWSALTRGAVRSPGWPVSGTGRRRPGVGGPCLRRARQRRCAAGAAASRHPEGRAAKPAEGGAATTGKEVPGTRRRSGADAPASAANAGVVLVPASAAPSRMAGAGRCCLRRTTGAPGRRPPRGPGAGRGSGAWAARCPARGTCRRPTGGGAAAAWVRRSVAAGSAAGRTWRRGRQRLRRRRPDAAGEGDPR